MHAKARAEGVSPGLFVNRVLEITLRDQSEPPKPLQTGYGMLAKYGPVPSAEEIDENRRDMFRNFARD